MMIVVILSWSGVVRLFLTGLAMLTFSFESRAIDFRSAPNLSGKRH
jgi:hypothetical protein